MKNYSSYFYLLLCLHLTQMSIVASDNQTPFALGKAFTMRDIDQNFYNTNQAYQLDVHHDSKKASSKTIISPKKRSITPVRFADEDEEKRLDRNHAILKNELKRELEIQASRNRISMAQQLESPEFKTILSIVQTEALRSLGNHFRSDQKNNFLKDCEKKAKNIYFNENAQTKYAYINGFTERRTQFYNQSK